MPVLTEMGLLGVVSAVGSEECTVTLLTDRTTQIGVYVEPGGGIGILQGELSAWKQGCALLEGLPFDAQAHVGDTVRTSGSGGIYPRGLAVGTVEEITNDPGNGNLVLRVRPFTNGEDVGEVMVLTDFSTKIVDASPQNQTHKFITAKQYDRSRSLEAYQEIILCKYGEIALKGANRRYFEDLLCRNLKRCLERFGDFAVERSQSTIRIIPRDEFCDIDGAYAQTKKVFGLVGVSRAAVCAKDTDTICDTLRHWCQTQLADVRTFKVEAKRSDKTFPLNSPQLCQLCGGVI